MKCLHHTIRSHPLLFISSSNLRLALASSVGTDAGQMPTIAAISTVDLCSTCRRSHLPSTSNKSYNSNPYTLSSL